MPRRGFFQAMAALVAAPSILFVLQKNQDRPTSQAFRKRDYISLDEGRIVARNGVVWVPPGEHSYEALQAALDSVVQ